MPRPKKRGKGRIKGYYNDQFFRELLLSGYDFCSLNMDQETIREAWLDLRKELMDEHRGGEDLFTRPAGWWWFDAPEMRRWIAPYSMPPVCYDKEPWLGRPYHREPGKAMICFPEDYESEKDYLLRHPKLLTDAEKCELQTEAPAHAKT